MFRQTDFYFSGMRFRMDVFRALLRRNDTL